MKKIFEYAIVFLWCAFVLGAAVICGIALGFASR
jgi:hypothetical protein